MPLIEEISAGQNRLGLWKIDGSENELITKWPKEYETLSVRHPRTQLQRFASRLLLAEMLGDMPLVEKDEHGKPLLPELHTCSFGKIACNCEAIESMLRCR